MKNKTKYIKNKKDKRHIKNKSNPSKKPTKKQKSYQIHEKKHHNKN
jgi:hypothetical protein